MTGVISLRWKMTKDDLLCAIVWEVKQRFTKGCLTEIT